MKKILLLMLTGLMTVSMYAQSVSGVVVDSDSRDGVIGASVIIKGTTTGTFTGTDGSFTLDLSGVSEPVILER
jgi:hypothetical protein